MSDEIVKKKRGRKPKLPVGDVMVPVEPPTPKHKTYSKKREKKEEVVEIDWDQFEKLCGYQCTAEEIADFFREDFDLFCDRVEKHYKKSFDDVIRIFGAPGLCSLRRSQFILAKTNSQMAIWLGKIYLKQIDPAQSRVEETVDRLTSVLEQIDEETKRALAQKDELNLSVF